jgi:hypothetical protein
MFQQSPGLFGLAHPQIWLWIPKLHSFSTINCHLGNRIFLF